MYSVLRFIAGPACSESTLFEVGSNLNSRICDAFGRLDHAGQRFSVSVSTASPWSAHWNEVIDFVGRIADVAVDAKARDVKVVLDIAIEPEDKGGALFVAVELQPSQLSLLARYDVGIMFTFYDTSDG